MNEYKIIILREKPELAPIAAEWFHCKWGVPTEAYLKCMEAYLSGKTENGWWLQYLIGHSDISVTLNVYTHVKFEDAKAEIERIANV